MNLLALSWLSEVGILTYRTATQGRPAAAGGGKVPWPCDFMASFVIYGGLAVVAEISPEWARFAAAFGWVLVLATVLDLVDPTAQGAANRASLTATATGQPATTAAASGGNAPNNATAPGVLGRLGRQS